MLDVLAPILVTWLVISVMMQIGAWWTVRLARRKASPCFGADVVPPAEGEPLCITVLGDLQKGVTDVVRPLAASLRERKPHLLLSTGDLVSHGEAPYFGIVFDAFEHAGIETPTRVTPGNHDLYPSRWKDAVGGPLFAKHFGGRRWVLDVGPLLIVSMDTGTRESQEPEIEWLKEQRATHGGRPWIALTHRPLIDIRDDGTTHEHDLSDLRAVLTTDRPELVLCGHLHDDHDLVHDGVKYVVSAGGDVSGTPLVRGAFSLVHIEVGQDGNVSVERTVHNRKRSWRALFNKLAVRFWKDRRKPMYAFLAAPAVPIMLLLGAYVPIRDPGTAFPTS
ncbi:MAG: metallophosphoesterase [Planctomycetota bacterium]|nr:metallophosphoesterase [Planctomycetota bacterium]